MNEINDKEPNLKTELDSMFNQLQTQINEIKAISGQTEEESSDKEDIGSELFLIKDKEVVIKNDKFTSNNNLLKNINLFKRDTLLINYDQEPSTDNSKLKVEAINEVVGLTKCTRKLTIDIDKSNRSGKEKSIFGSKKNQIDQLHNKKMDSNNIIEEKLSISNNFCNIYFQTENINQNTNNRMIAKKYNIEKNNLLKTCQYKNNNNNSKPYVDPKDVIIEEKEKDKNNNRHNKSNHEVNIHNNINSNIPLKLRRLRDVKINNDYCKKSCDTEEDRILTSINVCNVLNARKEALPSKQKISQSRNSKRFHKKNSSSWSSAKNHVISQLAFDIFNSGQDSTITKGTNKITFLTHTSQLPQMGTNNEEDFTFISSFDFNPNDEQSYTNSKFLTSVENNHKNYLIYRKGILSHSYYSAIVEATKGNSVYFTENYPNIVKKNYELIKDHYYFVYSNITIEEQNILYNLLVSQEVIKSYSKEKNEQKDNWLITNLYLKKDFINSYNYPSINNGNRYISFDYYRKFIADGDSFYRSFMFAYVEHLIIFKRKKKLMALFVDILRLSDIKTSLNLNLNQNIDFTKLMTLFSILSDLIGSEQYKIAYQCFLYSYLNSETSMLIDSVLLLYIKSCLFAFLNLSNNDDIGIKGKNEDISRIEIDNMLKNEMEPSQLIIRAIPYLFNVKLKIFYLEGEIHFAQIQCVDYFKLDKNDCNTKSNSNEDIHKSIIICLGNFYSNYNCIYSKDFYDTNTIFREINQSNIIKDQIEISISLIERKCIKCNCNTKIVNFHITNQKACLECLIKTINNILCQRAINFAKEGFINLEYYSRSIILNDNQIRISNSNLITISNSIPNVLSKILYTMCFNCYSKKQKLYSLSCSCQFCQECLLIILRKATNNKIILNSYESKLLPRLSCVCKGSFTYSEVMQCFSNILFEEEKLMAKNRLIQLVLRTCLVCLQDIFIGNSSKKDFRKLKLVEQKIKGRDFIDSEHVICSHCFVKIDNQIYEKIENRNNQRVYVYKEVKNVHCNICNILHSIDKTVWNKKNNSICCNKCSIY